MESLFIRTILEIEEGDVPPAPATRGPFAFDHIPFGFRGPPYRESMAEMLRRWWMLINQKVSPRNCAIWTGRLEMTQSLFYAIFFMMMAGLFFVEFDIWHRDVTKDPWFTESIPLTCIVLRQGFGITLLVCSVLCVLNLLLALVAFLQIHAAKSNDKRKVYIWFWVSGIVIMLQITNMIVMGALGVEGAYLGAFLGMQILLRMTTMFIVYIYYKTLITANVSGSRDVLVDENEAI